MERTLTRSMIFRRYAASRVPTSPVCSQPSSSIVSAVFFGSGAYVSGMFTHGEKSFRQTFVVARETLLAAHADLASGERLVLRGVAHGRDVDELELRVGHDRTDCAASPCVPDPRPREAGAVLGHAVSDSVDRVSVLVMR